MESITIELAPQQNEELAGLVTFVLGAFYSPLQYQPQSRAFQQTKSFSPFIYIHSINRA